MLVATVMQPPEQKVASEPLNDMLQWAIAKTMED